MLDMLLHDHTLDKISAYLADDLSNDTGMAA